MDGFFTFGSTAQAVMSILTALVALVLAGFLVAGLLDGLRRRGRRTAAQAVVVDDLGELDVALRLTSYLTDKAAVATIGDPEKWLHEEFVHDWRSAWACDDWLLMARQLKAADKILLDLWLRDWRKKRDELPGALTMLRKGGRPTNREEGN